MQESEKNSIIQPSKLAKKEGELRFSWQVKDFTRLCETLFSDKGDINVRIEGCYDKQDRCLIKSEIKAKLFLVCQTTFEPIEHQINSQVTFCTLTNEDQFIDVEKEYEPVLVEDGRLDLARVIEDELILSVPIVANKSIGSLAQKMSFGELDEQSIVEEKQASNPFLVLSNLKKT